MFWTVPKIWKGGECWIIGGGPSITRQFEIPDDVVRKVKSGELGVDAYSPYLSYLHNKHVIAVNMAYKIGDWIDMMFFGDRSFWDRVKRDLHKFPGLKVTCGINVDKQFPNVRMLKRKKGRAWTYGLAPEPNSVCWNSNSGAAAINLALHTGVKRIYLLGFDMQTKDPERHWHKLYGQISKSPPYLTHMRSFPAVKKDADKLGIEIINVNPDSAIKDFPRMSLKQIKDEN